MVRIDYTDEMLEMQKEIDPYFREKENGVGVYLPDNTPQRIKDLYKKLLALIDEQIWFEVSLW